MEMTRSELITALRRVGLLGSVDSGYFDNMLTSNSGTDHTAEIEALQAKDISQDSTIQQIDQRVVTLENKPDAVDYSSQISALQTNDISQNNRISANESSLLSKAGLVNGKVPYEQLPEFPVGRKVNVANQAARFALPVYADLTIAYQSDTGDAWGLDANADPAISANWSKLGNAQGIGVASFNGRTGNIGPMSGDYNTGQVTEIVDKRFVTSDQITEWNAKETTTGSQAKASAAQASAKTYADSTFIAINQKGVNGGVAPLDSNGKVPLVNLPSGIGGEWVKPTVAYADVKASRSAGTWYLNNLEYDKTVEVLTNSVVGVTPSYIEVRNNTTNQIYKIDSLAVGGGSGNIVATQKMTAIVPAGFSYRLTLVSGRVVDTWLELNQTAGSTFTPVSQKGIANGVAPLDATGKVPVANLPTGTPRTWKDVRDSRTYNSWIKNNTSSEMDIFVRTNAINDAAQYLTIQMRANSTSTSMSFQSTYINVTGARYLQFSGVVPIGWDYAVTIQGGGTPSIANIGIWRELSV